MSRAAVDDQYQAWLGKTVTREDIATPRIAAEFSATLSPHLFPHADPALCPPGLHWCLAPALLEAAALAADGTEAGGGFLPPMPLPKRMWAGGRIETFAAIRIGTAVTRRSTLVDAKLRHGKSGPLGFVTIMHEISGGGALALRERQDLVFRAAGSVIAVSPPAPPPKSDLQWTVEASELLLFRFSAMTFNGHRIHYDLGFARDEEGYAGLLVHGPLQAALLLNQFAALNGSIPRVFDYRCVAPLVAGGGIAVGSRRIGEGTSGEIRDAGGTVTMVAGARAPEI